MNLILVEQGDMDFLSGGGEMGELIRSRDWSKIPTGAPEIWSLGLHTVVRIMACSSIHISTRRSYLERRPGTEQQAGGRRRIESR